MNKIIKILVFYLLILEIGSTLLDAQKPPLTRHRQSHKKKKTRRTLKRMPLNKTRKNKYLRKKMSRERRSFKLRRNHLCAKNKHSRHLKTKRKLSHRRRLKKQAAISRRSQRMQENLPPDSISINYAELKVRRMLAQSELPPKNRIQSFNKIMQTLDRYEKNGHVSIQDMEQIVSKEINF